MQDHLGPSDLHFIKLDKGPLGNATFEHLSQVILKKKIFEYFLCISMV